MLLNTLKGFPFPPNPTPTGKCRLDVYECQSWRPDTLSPTRCSAPALLAVTQPLAIEVEIYLLIAWILLDFCLELRVLRVARLPGCQAACAEVHTRLNTRCTRTCVLSNAASGRSNSSRSWSSSACDLHEISNFREVFSSSFAAA